MVYAEGSYTKIIIVLLVVALLFSALSIVVSLSIHQSFKSDFIPIRSTAQAVVTGTPESSLGLQVVRSVGVGS